MLGKGGEEGTFAELVEVVAGKKNIKYNLASESWGDEEIDAIQQVIKSNRYTMGPKVKEFEKRFYQNSFNI